MNRFVLKIIFIILLATNVQAKTLEKKKDEIKKIRGTELAQIQIRPPVVRLGGGYFGLEYKVIGFLQSTH